MTSRILSPKMWGARVDYDLWPADPTPRERIAAHWNGPAVTGYKLGVAREQQILRGMERYHIDVRGWSGIGYGWAVGYSGTIYRCRGDARLGAHLGDYDDDDIPENRETSAVVFLLGEGQTPSANQYRAFRHIQALEQAQYDRQLLAIGHREIAEQGTGTATSCPGDDIMAWVAANRRLEVTAAAGDTPILAPATATIDQTYAWLTLRDAHPRLFEVVSDAYRYGHALAVDPVVAVALAHFETAGGHYSRTVTPDSNNWGGIKTSDGSTFADFDTPEDGMLAVVQHLRLYAAGPVPNPVDPRHFAWIAGTVTTVEGLGGTWSTGIDYGVKLAELADEISETVPLEAGYVDRASWPAYAREAIEWAIDEGIMIGSQHPDGTRRWNPTDTPTRADLAVTLHRLHQKGT